MLWPHRPALTRFLFVLAALIPFVLQTRAFADPAPTRYPAMLLHIGSPTGKNPCAAGAVAPEDVVTSAPAAPDGSKAYFVYILARNGYPDTTNTLAGLEVGIQYDAPGPGQGIKVNDWHSCGVFEFPMPGWPASGKGNLIVWDPSHQCQTGDLAVAGYFYVAAYSAATMSLTPRPASGRATVANCGNPADEEFNAMESPVFPGRLGWVSFGGGERNGDADGFNPVTEPLFQTAPYIALEVGSNSPPDSIPDDDVTIIWYALDDVRDSLEFSSRLDGGLWTHPDYSRSPYNEIDPLYSVGLRNLPIGPHHFELEARDADGETTQASVDFTTLWEPNDPPETFLTGGPGEGDTVSVPITFSWSGTDDRTPVEQLQFFYRLDNEPGAAMIIGDGSVDPASMTTTTVTFDSLPPGPHMFSVNAHDSEEEWDRTPAIRHFVVRAGIAPVTLSAFTADNTAGAVVLHWSYALDGPVTFQVQRAPDPDSPFLQVSNLISRWTSGNEEWSDLNVPELGVLYYRLGWLEGRDWSYSEPIRVVRTPVFGFAFRSIEPNPGRGLFTFAAEVDRQTNVRVEVFDVGGRLIRLVRAGIVEAGQQSFQWAGDSDDGQPAPSGIYFVRLSAGDRSVSRRFVLTR